MMDTHWIANRALISQLQPLIKKYNKILKDLNAFKEEVGADSVVFSDYYILGFTFKDESLIDKKLFCRARRSHYWKPRAKTVLCKTMQKFHIMEPIHEIMKLIKMKNFSGDGTIRYPRIDIHKGNVYFTTPKNVKLNQCKLVSDVKFKKIRKTNKFPGYCRSIFE